MSQCWVLLVHLLADKDGKNEYVRTLSVALAVWQPWMDKIPAVCFVEESCEALLSRMGHRYDVYRTLHGFDNTFDLFLTLPPQRRGKKATRGMLKQGLVAEFAARIRSLVFSSGDLLYAAPGGAKEMHSIVQKEFHVDVPFPGPLPLAMPRGELEYLLRRCLRNLLGKTNMSDELRQFF